MGENRRAIMVLVEGYWKVQLVCLILLILIAIAIIGFVANDGNREGSDVPGVIAVCTDIPS